jgi:2-(3-amino-3-carboxypropyl)histidine synthase
MIQRTFEEISEKYELEIDKIVRTINVKKAKRVLLQFPEGMKPYAQAICDKIETITKCEFFIWLDSCFGACDVPLEVERLGIDLAVQFGHSEFKK